MFFKVKFGHLFVLLLVLPSVMLSGCGSMQYAEVRRFISHEDYAQARVALETGGPTDAQGWALLAECRLGQQDYLGVAEAATKSLAISSEFRTEIDHFLQQAFMEQLNDGVRAYDDGNDPEASRLFNQLLVFCEAIRPYLTPDMARMNQKVAALAGAIAINLKDYPNARAYLEGLKSQWRSNPALLERLAFIYYQMGEPQLCAATCETLLVRAPLNSTVLQLRAQACQQLGHADATVNAYRDALERSANSIVLNRNLGIILFQLEDWKQARFYLENATRGKTSDSLSLMVMIAECLYNEGDYAGALQHFKRAADVQGPDPDLYRAIGACHRNLGDRVQADAAFREADRISHRDAAAWNPDSTAVSPKNIQSARGRQK